MKPFPERLAGALADENVAAGLLGFQRSWRETRDAQIAELETEQGQTFDELRGAFADAKRAVREDWDAHIDRFRSEAEAAGSIVTLVATAEEANAHVAQVCRRHDARLLVKGKSMVSEEIGLNAYLEERGITPVETDLGEWILQLAHEHPSHLVMPAIHKRRHQIAELLTTCLDRTFDPDDIPAMVIAARTELRDQFLAAGVGLTGANALVAQSGAIMLVCNEGNNRMSVALPGVHIAVVGIEKLVSTYAEAIQQVRLLARSATGQPITTYTNFVTGPRPGQEQHIVLIDNGRSAMAASPDFDQALGCIRCGACANVCPPYQVVGGHAFGHVYSGAIGLVNTPFHHGMEAAEGPQSLCVSCGACAQVCPADIPLPTQILDVRHKVVSARGLSTTRRTIFRALRSRRTVAAGIRIGALVSRPFTRDGFVRIPDTVTRWVPALRAQTSWRSIPALPATTGRTRLARRTERQPAIAGTQVTGRRVMLFLQCVSDRIAPEIVTATVRLLEACGAEVVVPPQQHCCGLPAYDSGDHDSAKVMARATISALAGVDDVVTPAPSCVVSMAHEYGHLLRDEEPWAARAAQLAGRVHDLVSYLAGPGRLPTGALDNGDVTPVTVHRFCQSGNVLGHTDQMEELLRDVCRVPVRPLAENGVCCGFGGSTSLTTPQVAEGILDRKLGCVDDTGAEILVSDNPGCVLHMRSGADASGRELQVRHPAEYLAARLPDAEAP